VLGPGAPDFVPDSLVPRPLAYGTAYEDELERVAGASGDDLVSDLVADAVLDSTWSTVARRPRPWVHRYLGVMRRAWDGVAPLWEEAAPLREREAERVGAALARGTLAYALAASEKLAVGPDDRLVDWRGVRFDLAGAVIVPIVTGPRSVLVGERAPGGVVDYLAYPLPGLGRLDGAWPGAPARPRPPTGLVALLGLPRATLLRRLDAARAAGELAAALSLPPSAVTHHVAALERAGLVRRERRGQRVLVHRTGTGTSLLALYE
jgi:DNA-binding transcriptional ArsR family regulator